METINFMRQPEPMFVDGISFIDCFPAYHNETKVVEKGRYYDKGGRPQRKVLIEGRYVMDNGYLHPVFWSPEVKAWVYFDMDTLWSRYPRSFDHLDNPHMEQHGKQLSLEQTDVVFQAIDNLGIEWINGIEDGKPAFIFFDWKGVDNELPILAMKLGIAADQNAENILSSMGVSPFIHFADDTDVCIDCRKLVYTADGSFQGHYEETDDGTICEECIHKSVDAQDSVIATHVNRPRGATTVLYDYELKAAGFKKLSEGYENGWYGRLDDPSAIMKHLHERWHDVLFQANSCNPWNVAYVAWVREEKEAMEV